MIMRSLTVLMRNITVQKLFIILLPLLLISLMSCKSDPIKKEKQLTIKAIKEAESLMSNPLPSELEIDGYRVDNKYFRVYNKSEGKWLLSENNDEKTVIYYQHTFPFDSGYINENFAQFKKFTENYIATNNWLLYDTRKINDILHIIYRKNNNYFVFNVEDYKGIIITTDLSLVYGDD